MKTCLGQILILLSFLSFNANAGLLVEPYAGFSFGSGEQGALDLSHSGLALGTRIGFQTLGFMVGGEYSLRPSYEMEATGTTGISTLEQSRNSLGVFVGYNFPLLVRVWGTYYFSSKETIEESTSAAVNDQYKGSGIALGVGYTGLPFISLNLEYRSLTFDEYEDATTSNTSTLVANRETSEILFSVSAPFDL